MSSAAAFGRQFGDVEKNQQYLYTARRWSGPDDWDLGYTITYKNMAALDGLPDKVYELRMKQYGDHASEQKVIDKRVENAHVVTSNLIRGITLR